MWKKPSKWSDLEPGVPVRVRWWGDKWKPAVMSTHQAAVMDHNGSHLRISGLGQVEIEVGDSDNVLSLYLPSEMR